MFALVDANNFYCACERVFDPALNRRPVVVLSNNDGCAVARSDEARALGVAMGTPAFQVRSLLRRHRVAVFSSNYTLYADMSRRAHDVLRTFAPVEVYSIDEAFLDLSKVPLRDREDFARDLRQTLRRQTGLPVSIGIGETKTLAKVANGFVKRADRAGAKSGGVLDLAACGCRDDILDAVDVAEVWGVGRAHAPRLRAAGIETARQLRDLGWNWARANTVVAKRLVLELRGESCIPLERAPPPRKSATASRTFARATRDLEEVREAVATFAARAAAKVRREELAAGAINVYVGTDVYREHQPQYHPTASMRLAVPTDDTGELIGAALELLGRLWRPGYAYRKAAVLLLELCEAGKAQAGLFDGRDRAASARLMGAMDAANRRHGRGTLRLGAEGFHGGTGTAWDTRRALLSPAYTTRWGELAVAYA